MYTRSKELTPHQLVLRRATRKRYNHRKRAIVLEHYNYTCNCCKVKFEQEFLGIDHINGGGGKHRKEPGICGGGIYRWLIKNNFPPEFQCLCHNCNQAKGYWGTCPHQRNA